MDYIIREMRSEEYCLLSDFLYEAIYIPEGIEPPPKSVIECPELQEYIVEFGNRKHDKALVAEIQGNVVGAIWVRIMNDYGHIDNVPFPVSWTVKMKKKQKETQDILSYHTQAAGCSDKARAKASGGRQPIEECGRTGL